MRLQPTAVIPTRSLMPLFVCNLSRRLDSFDALPISRLCAAKSAVRDHLRNVTVIGRLDEHCTPVQGHEPE